MNSIDYRLAAAEHEERTYFADTDCDVKFEMDRLYEELVSRETSAAEGPQSIEVLGRTLYFERTCGKLLDVTFRELCAKPLGPSDYLEICK